MEKFEVKSTPAGRIYALMQLEKGDIFIIFCLTLGAGLLYLATPVAVQTLVNIVTMGGVVQPLIVVALMLFVLLLLSGGLNLLEFYVVELIQRRIFVRAALQSAMKAQSMQVSVRDSENTVEIMNRFFDVATLQKTTYQLLTKGLAAFLQAIVGSVVLVSYSYYFVFVVLLLLVIAWIIFRVVGRIAIQTAIKESYAKYEMGAWLESIGRNVNMFKFCRGQMLAMQNADAIASSYLERRKSHFSVLFKQNILALLAYAIAGSIMLGLGGFLVMQSQINLGQFVAAELIIFSVLSAFSMFISQLEYLYDMSAALDKLGLIQDLPSERVGGDFLTANQAFAVEAENLALLTDQVHSPVNLQVASGASLAVLVSASHGKSFLAEMLVGLRNPDSGVVKINQIDVRLLDLQAMREHVVYLQHVETLEDSILNNLTLQYKDVSLQSVQEALFGLGLDQAISALPDGLNTILLPSGAPLNKIQARLLMVARATLLKPRLIVIDELLDALSGDELDIVCRALRASPAGWSLIVVTSKREIAGRFDEICEMGAQ